MSERAPLATLLDQPKQEVDFSEWLTVELKILHEQLLKLVEFATRYMKWRPLWNRAMVNIEDRETFQKARIERDALELLSRSMALHTCGEEDQTLPYFITIFELTAKHVAFLLAVRESNIPIPPIHATLEKLTLNKVVAWYVLTIRQKAQSTRV